MFGKKINKRVKKTVLGLVAGVVCLSSVYGSVYGSVIYMPDDDFVNENRDTLHIEENNRWYDITDNTKYYNRPNGEIIERYCACAGVQVYYTYDDGNIVWGCVDENAWIDMSTVNLVYDNIEFFKDNENKITDYNGELQGYTLKLPIELYEYPGKGYGNEITKEGRDLSVSLSSWLTPRKVYVDEEGTKWGYINSYNQESFDGWYIISDLEKGDVIEEIAGDINFDCKVDLKDAGETLQASLGIKQLSKGQIINSDVNKDEKVNLTDTTIILKAALGISSVECSVLTKDIHFSVERISNTQNIIQYTIFNNTDKDISYGYHFMLEKYVDGKWEIVKYNEHYMIPDIAVLVEPGRKSVETVNLRQYFDNLTEGRYRIRKDMNSSKYYAEFQL